VAETDVPLKLACHAVAIQLHAPLLDPFLSPYMSTHSLSKRALVALPDKGTLFQEYVGKKLTDLPTPSFIVDRSIVARNCAEMHRTASQWDANFRAHVKTHKVC